MKMIFVLDPVAVSEVVGVVYFLDWRLASLSTKMDFDSSPPFAGLNGRHKPADPSASWFGVAFAGPMLRRCGGPR